MAGELTCLKVAVVGVERLADCHLEEEREDRNEKEGVQYVEARHGERRDEAPVLQLRIWIHSKKK